MLEGILNHNLWKLAFDVTANDGWNITAWIVWLCILWSLFHFTVARWIK